MSKYPANFPTCAEKMTHHCPDCHATCWRSIPGVPIPPPLEGYFNKQLRTRDEKSFPVSFGKDGDLDWQAEGKPKPRLYCLDCRKQRKRKYQQQKTTDQIMKYGPKAAAIVLSKREELRNTRRRICLGEHHTVPKPRKGAPNHWCELCRIGDKGAEERLALGPHFFRIAKKCLARRRVRLKTLTDDMASALHAVERDTALRGLTVDDLFERFKVFKRSPCFLAVRKNMIAVHHILGTKRDERKPLYLALACGTWRTSFNGRYIRASESGVLYHSKDGSPPWEEHGFLTVTKGTLWEGPVWRLKIQGSTDDKLLWSSKYSKDMREKLNLSDKIEWTRVSLRV